MSAVGLTKAREVKERNRRARQRAQLKQAQEWLRLMREEAKWRRIYIDADEPRARERARKSWLHVRDEWHKVGTPQDEAIREARKLERSDR